MFLLRNNKVYSTYATPLTDIENGGAPKLLGPEGDNSVLPDFELHCISNGTNGVADFHGYVEHKWKSQATRHRITNTFQHGFGRRLFDNYCKVSERTGRPLLIMVYENDINLRWEQDPRYDDPVYMALRKAGVRSVALIGSITLLGIHHEHKDNPGEHTKGVDPGGMVYFDCNKFTILHPRGLAYAPDMFHEMADEFVDLNKV